jgi:DNA-binding FadR family transcriptional regulator
MAKPLSRSALLARELLGTIARGELQPGDPIDLHALGRRHGVSRTVVREALADLGGKGLVLARPKVGTTVAPDAQWHMLDPVLVAVASAETGPGSMLAEAAELRRVIEPAIAADAARDASTAQRAAVLRAVRALADAIGTADRDGLATADAALHEAIAGGCGNRLLRSIDRSLVPVRALQRERLHAIEMSAAGPGPVMLRCLAIQTGLGLAIARRDVAAAPAWALALASVARAGSHAAGPAADADRDREPLPMHPTHPDRAAGRPAFPPGPALDPPRTVPAANEPDDWPATTTLVREAGAPIPMRRGRLDPTESDHAAVTVPALLGSPGPALARLR